MKRTSKIKDRRALRFGRMEELLKDVESLDACLAAGGAIRTSGNWTAAQIVEHVARMIHCSIDGFEGQAPLLLRAVAKWLRGRVLNHPMRAGLRLPARFAYLAPATEVTWPQAVASLRKAIHRLQGGTRMTAPSPVLGRLAHEEWIQLHCRHAEMHFGFMHAEPAFSAHAGGG